jgi:hypothetical protein
MAGIVVVTDSTASLPSEVVDKHGITVVPLQVVIGAEVYDEGDEGATSGAVAAALREFKPVSTSRPAPARMLDVYEQLAAGGAEGIVSVHLSSEMSGTFESAQLAARQASLPVALVDSRQVGVGTGYAALAAAEALARGAALEEASSAATTRAETTRSLFYVDTLEYLRRGGRVGAAAGRGGGPAPGGARPPPAPTARDAKPPPSSTNRHGFSAATPMPSPRSSMCSASERAITAAFVMEYRPATMGISPPMDDVLTMCPPSP